MNPFKSLSMGTRLLVSVIPLILLVLLFSTREMYGHHTQLNSLQGVHAQMGELAAGQSLMVSLQNERSRTAALMAGEDVAQSLTGNAAQTLARQREETDRYLADQGRDTLAGLEELRRDIDARAISLGDATSTYSEIILNLLDPVESVIQQATGAAVTRQLGAYHALASSSEMAGREQAQGMALLADGDFSVPTITSLAELVGKQSSSLVHAMSMLPEHNALRARIRELSNSDEHQAMESLRAQLFSSRVAADTLSAEDWFTVSAVWMERLGSLQEQTLAQSVDRVEQAVSSADRARVLAIVLAAGALVLMLMVALIMISWTTRTSTPPPPDVLAGIRQALEHRDFTHRIKSRRAGKQAPLIEAVNELLAQVENANERVERARKEATVRPEPIRPEPPVEDRAVADRAVVDQSRPVQTTEQRHKVTRVTQAAETLSSRVQDVSGKVRAVADASKAMQGRNQTSEQALHHSIQGMQALSDSVVRVNSVVEDLETRTEGISEMLQVIRKVADKTNLLALNAAIEAARAGEHGRGFAVVAGEVRTLARQTQESTARIEDIINGLTSVTENAGRAAMDSQALADEASERARHLEQAIAELIAEVGRISDMAMQAASASEGEVSDTQTLAQRLRDLRSL